LLLARVSNVPTIWTNVLAGYVCAIAPLDSIPVALLSLSLLYTAGMFLNDVCDVPFDTKARADRPIPNGDVGRVEAMTIVVVLFAAALALLLRQPYPGPAINWAIVLIVAASIYDLSHKGKWYGPVVMGACRALVYCVAAASATGVIDNAVPVPAITMWLYVMALTWVAKAAKLGYAVPWMLAGICLIDAAIIAWMGQPRLALIAAAGFPLTLAFQRVVPGT
jgi:4-hydroxybenzoate polyprenyltransferase